MAPRNDGKIRVQPKGPRKAGMSAKNNGASSFLDITKKGLAAGIRNKMDNGLNLGVTGFVPTVSPERGIFNPEFANLKADASFPLGNGKASAFIDNERNWEVKLKQKLLANKLNLEAKTGSRGQGVRADYQVSDDFNLGANFKRNPYGDSVGGELRYQPNDKFSAFLKAKRQNDANKFNIGASYNF